MTEFVRKFENRSIKIALINAILYHEIYQFTVIYFNFVRVYGPLWS